MRGMILIALLGGCVAIDDVEPGDTDELAQLATSCAIDAPGVYTPYPGAASYRSGTVAAYPWRGRGPSPAAPYPSGAEAFEGYTPPTAVECGNDKDRRSHLDVTAGCLRTAAVSSYRRGQVQATSDGYFRAVALGYASGDTRPMKWTDQSIEYRFWYRERTGTAGNPGFKAFVRYRSENDLYVASWRFDGVVQIQKKVCGRYTALAVDKEFGAPSPGAWHRIRLDAIGDRLDLYLDGTLVMSVHDSALTWGTAGIRVDAADGAYLDDWKVR